ncbi:amino acid adenylation domain-containing protein [Kribbella sandramycini]|uniref:Amino acid adenylation domain-containing protein n=1 Tax=Kribbella sandramycini TaxID=60450 RepID=A0A7Y4L1R1_9ACTN|nr:amino acid adenylation domain-containing protein [Kribbella sandramycini]MBB6566600.1 amino acid adenylation domain-containing protein [Kribbella sandramycini]NOL42745.1 amino acid adenylation domain-containing protein [Kribbella sandramycini]
MTNVVPELEAVLEQVALRPDDAAVAFQGEVISYQELWDRSGRVADHVRELGATRAGVHLERSIDLVVAVVGLLRADCAAVPLDVGYPVERLRFMCADAGVRTVVGHADPLARLGGYIAVQQGGALVYAVDESVPVQPAEAELAYVVYTSGSTGRPKGVRYAHRNLANLIAWQSEASSCGVGDRTLQFAPSSFDIIYQEVLTTLGEGGTVVCCTEDERLDPQELWDLIEREQVNRIFVPFVMIQSLALFADDVSPATHPLREILTAGEQVQAGERIRAMFTRLPACRLVNQWGTTETHVSTSYELPADVSTWEDLPSIGMPIRDTRILVCDEDGRPVPDGEVGELWVAGTAVGPGYLGLPERTAQSYVPDPQRPDEPAYRTGDLGRVRPDGLLEFLGRQDTQVKVRGFRIELGEIETVLNSDPAVAQAVVSVAGSAAEERYLRAHVVPKAAGDDKLPAALLATLRERLPAYMVPTGIELVPALPLTASGKIDRLAL